MNTIAYGVGTFGGGGMQRIAPPPSPISPLVTKVEGHRYVDSPVKTDSM